MNIAKQLFQLQETDIQLESDEQTLKLIINQIGESSMIIRAQEKLDSERKNREEIASRQRSIEWDMEDIAGKLKKIEGDLYSGRIRNPKELTDLQHESETLKSNITKLEEQALELMEKLELATKNAAEADSTLNRLKNEWQRQQQKLSADMEKLNRTITALKEKRRLLAASIDPETVEIYDGLRKQKGAAVARVQQGTCLGCRISLPISDLQRVKGGSMVRCSSCGRILYQA